MFNRSNLLIVAVIVLGAISASSPEAVISAAGVGGARRRDRVATGDGADL
jgi:hypothetical protein